MAASVWAVVTLATNGAFPPIEAVMTKLDWAVGNIANTINAPWAAKGNSNNQHIRNAKAGTSIKRSTVLAKTRVPSDWRLLTRIPAPIQSSPITKEALPYDWQTCIGTDGKEAPKRLIRGPTPYEMIREFFMTTFKVLVQVLDGPGCPLDLATVVPEDRWCHQKRKIYEIWMTVLLDEYSSLSFSLIEYCRILEYFSQYWNSRKWPIHWIPLKSTHWQL